MEFNAAKFNTANANVNQNQSFNEKSDDKPKPRFGDYEPKDVAIDKFFYFGNKK